MAVLFGRTLMLADKAHNAKDFDVPREPLNVTPGKLACFRTNGYKLNKWSQKVHKGSKLVK
jgi:hypothetical protein